MSSAFKRVISNPEELGNTSKRMSMGENAEDKLSERLADANLLAQTEDEAKLPASPPAIVECDDQIENTDDVANDIVEGGAGETVLQFHASSSTTSSSLSDRSAENQEGDDEKDADAGNPPATVGIRRNQGNLLNRSDSKVSTDSIASSARSGTSGHGGSGSGNWGWFEDVHGADGAENKKKKKSSKKGVLFDDNGSSGLLSRVIDISHPSVDNEAAAAAMAVTAPNYVLEESLSSQKLWKHTAGNRPPQPEEERLYFEKMWAQNFAMSRVDYKVPVEVLTAGTPISFSAFADNHFDAGGHGRDFSNYNLATDSRATDAEVAEAIERLHGYTTAKEIGPGAEREVLNKKVKGNGSEEDLTVLIRGDNVFGTTVSKSFDKINSSGNREVDTVNISIASYRVVESKKHGKYAQFLVIYREGSIRDTIGVWKRYSDFEALSNMVTKSHDSCSSVIANMSPLAVTEEPDVEHLPNAITSWRLLKKRQRWFRCLDAGYLSLKVFLLERFLHDILFESSTPNLLRDFVIYDTTTPK